MSLKMPAATKAPRAADPSTESPNGLLKVAIWKHDSDRPDTRPPATAATRAAGVKDAQSYGEDLRLRLSIFSIRPTPGSASRSVPTPRPARGEPTPFAA